MYAQATKFQTILTIVFVFVLPIRFLTAITHPSVSVLTVNYRTWPGNAVNLIFYMISGKNVSKLHCKYIFRRNHYNLSYCYICYINLITTAMCNIVVIAVIRLLNTTISKLRREMWCYDLGSKNLQCMYMTVIDAVFWCILPWNHALFS